MPEFLMIEIYLDAARFTMEQNVNSREETFALPKETIIETLLVTQNNRQIDYTVVSRQSEHPEISRLNLDLDHPVTISYFISNVKWSAAHKVLVNQADGVQSNFRLEIAVHNGSQEPLKAETIYVVNQHFNEQSRSHGYQMKAYERSEMTSSPRGTSSYTSSNLMISLPHRIPLASQSLQTGVTRFTVDGQLVIQKTYFSFPISEDASHMPAKFVMRLFTNADAPAAEAYFYDMQSLDFLGQSSVKAFAKGHTRAVDVSLTTKLLGNVMIREDVNEEKTTKDKLVTSVLITTTIYNMDYLQRTVILTLPAQKNMTNKNDLKDLIPVDGNYEFELTIPPMLRDGPHYNMRTTTVHKVAYDYWTERRH
jgi:hypothetical protein